MRTHRLSGIFDWIKPEKPAPKPPQQTVDLYAILQVNPGASQDEIRTAYHEIAKRFHPDRDPSPGAERIFKAAADAYRVLSNPEQRAAYDRTYRPAPIVPPSTSLVPSERREIPAGRRPGQRPPPSSRALAFWEKALGPSEEPAGEAYSVFAPRARETRPEPSSVFARREEAFAPRRQIMEIPSVDDLADWIESSWPLDVIWELVRQMRVTPEFQRSRLLVVDRVAERNLEYDLAEILGVPYEVVLEYDRMGLIQNFWTEVLIPIVQLVPQAMGALKPDDIPGAFFLDYGDGQRAVELFYSEARI